MVVRKASSSRAFFLELVLDLVVFAICAVICLQVFAEAHIESVRSAALSKLGVEAQEVSEQFKASNGNPSLLADTMGAAQNGNTLSWYYDQRLNSTTEEKAYFVLTCIIDDSQSVKEARVALDEVSQNTETSQLFEFTVSSYRRAEGGGS